MTSWLEYLFLDLSMRPAAWTLKVPVTLREGVAAVDGKSQSLLDGVGLVATTFALVATPQPRTDLEFRPRTLPGSTVGNDLVLHPSHAIEHRDHCVQRSCLHAQRGPPSRDWCPWRPGTWESSLRSLPLRTLADSCSGAISFLWRAMRSTPLAPASMHEASAS